MSDRTKNARRPQGPDDWPAPDRQRMLPASIEAEMGLVCSALLSPDVLDEIRTTPEQFHAPAHKLAWEQITAMRQERKPVDVVTLTQRLHDRLLLEQCGGAAYISQLFTYLPTAANAEHYAEIV